MKRTDFLKSLLHKTKKKQLQGSPDGGKKKLAQTIQKLQNLSDHSESSSSGLPISDKN